MSLFLLNLTILRIKLYLFGCNNYIAVFFSERYISVQFPLMYFHCHILSDILNFELLMCTLHATPWTNGNLLHKGV